MVRLETNIYYFGVVEFGPTVKPEVLDKLAQWKRGDPAPWPDRAFLNIRASQS